MENYSHAELLGLGFSSVGENVVVSRDARFFSISGSLDDEVRIDAYAVMTGHIELGRGVHISPFCFMGGTGGKIVMEAKSGLSTHVSVFTKSDDYAARSLDEADKVTGDVLIKSGAIVGSGSRVMPGVTIREDVSIGCNSIINKDIERGAVVINRGMALVNLSRRDQP